MSEGIAIACREAGAQVRVTGRSLARAQEVADAAAVSAVEFGREAVADADMVIETVLEDRDVKTAVLARVARWTSESALIATNTSSLTVGSLADRMHRPERFAGLHFLYPANLTGVVEIIPGPRTREDVLDAWTQLVQRMAKRPLRLCRDIPGFVWNRLQFALLRECLYLLQAGVASAPIIDAAVSDGLAARWIATGPLATADLGGSATFEKVANELFPRLSDAHDPGDALRDSDGFYRWSESARSAVDALRRDALATGRRVSERRGAIMPPPSCTL